MRRVRTVFFLKTIACVDLELKTETSKQLTPPGRGTGENYMPCSHCDSVTFLIF